MCLCGNNCVGCLLQVFVVYFCCNFILKHIGGHSWLGLMWISQRLDDDASCDAIAGRRGLQLKSSKYFTVCDPECSPGCFPLTRVNCVWGRLQMRQAARNQIGQDLLLEQEPDMKTSLSGSRFSSFWSSQLRCASPRCDNCGSFREKHLFLTWGFRHVKKTVKQLQILSPLLDFNQDEWLT